MDEFRAVSNYKEPSSFNLGRNILLPFVCGILGTTLVIFTCFSNPTIRAKLNIEGGNSSTTTTSSTPINLGNTNLISLTNYSDTAVSVADKVLPSIVGIRVEFPVTSIFGGQSTTEAAGSGIIISEDGYILTNNHIVQGESSYFSQVSEANKVKIYLYNDPTEYEGTIVGTDSQTDLAVIKIEKTGLTPAELGDSSSVRVGEFAMAIGNPLGMDSSVTCGIISAINREVSDSSKEYTLIQTDAAINSRK